METRLRPMTVPPSPSTPRESVPAETPDAPLQAARPAPDPHHVPWWSNVHFVVCWLAGLSGMMLGFLAFGMALGTGNFVSAGVCAAVGLVSVSWLPAAVGLRRHSRASLGWIVATFVFLTVLNGWRFADLAAYHDLLEVAQPSLSRSLDFFAPLLMATFGGALARFFVPHRAPQARGSKLPLYAALGLYATAILAAAFALPPLLAGRARLEAEELRRLHPPRAAPKPILGATLTPIFGAAYRPYEVGWLSREALESGYEAELASILASGARTVAFRVSQLGEGEGPKAEVELLGRLVQQARDGGARIVFLDVPKPYRAQDPPQSWQNFRERHATRVKRYNEEFMPDVFLLASSIYGYHRLGEIAGMFEHEFHQNAWESHLADLAESVKKKNPGALVGVAFEPWIPEDTEQYRRMLAEENVDILAFSPQDLAGLEAARRLTTSQGHPESEGQRLWLVNMWRGHPVEPRPAEDADTFWMEALAGWAQDHSADALLYRPGASLAPGALPGDLWTGALGAHWAAGQGELSNLGRRLKELIGLSGRGWSEPRPDFDVPRRPARKEPKEKEPKTGRHPHRGET
ncbi:MAG: hypothetical protein M5U26_27775 [Planctomycetota bacterium]|nr:hypothetical protein [Planctomycetota bacterium]